MDSLAALDDSGSPAQVTPKERARTWGTKNVYSPVAAGENRWFAGKVTSRNSLSLTAAQGAT